MKHDDELDLDVSRPFNNGYHARPDLDVSRPFTLIEERWLRSKISMYLCNLQDFALYWVPSLQRLAGRGRNKGDPFVNTRGSPALPRDAILIGWYAQGDVRTDTVLEDLEDVLARG